MSGSAVIRERERWAKHTVTPDEAGQTVQEILTGTLGLSRWMLQKLTRSRGLRFNGKPAFLAKKVRAGDVVAARIAAAEEATLEPVPMELAIVHEDADVLALDKPPFVFVHPTAPHHTATLAHGVAYHWAQQGLQARVRPVHRLDRDTSGLLLIAKTAFAHQHLDRQLRERTLKREYLALVRGVVEAESGPSDAPIGRHRQSANLRAVRPDGDTARTHYEVIERFHAATLLRLELDTGRTHQIRVHLEHLGHPVLGDRAYGGAGLERIRRPALHAARLRFVHPTSGEPIELEAPLPADMAAAREALRGAPAD